MVGAEPVFLGGGLARVVLQLVVSKVVMKHSVPNLCIPISFHSALYLLSSPSDMLHPEIGLQDSGFAGC